jgi:hypothetical protein
MKFLYQKEDQITEQNGEVLYMRSFMAFGLPLQIGDTRYKDFLDRQADQQ